MMPSTTVEPERKAFRPGTTGWTSADLDDPEIERQWDAGPYEIIAGILTIMPPAYFDGSVALNHLVYLIQQHLAASGIGGRFGPEADVIISEDRVLRPDSVYLSEDDLQRQEKMNAAVRRGHRRMRKYGRILIPPTLIIESLSEGHEKLDREIKRRWYAEFKVPNYWILDSDRRYLECLVLDGAAYRIDAAGENTDELKPAAFPGLVIPLATLWA